MDRLDRAGFLALAARGGAGIAVAAAGAGALGVVGAGAARAATAASGPLADADLASARLAASAELLAVDFYGKAIDAGVVKGDALKALRRILFNEQEHLAAVSGVLTGAGQAPPSADDFEISYPDGTFASQASVAKLAVTLETAFLGIHLGAVAAYAPADLRAASASIATSEAEHLAFLRGLAGGRPVGISFPTPLDLAGASEALAPFLS